MKIAVWGQGAEGKAAFRWAVEQGYNPFYIKENENNENADLLIVSPGIPWRRKDVQEYAKKCTFGVTNGTEIFLSKNKNKTITITGTKGKSTTSKILYEILKDKGINVCLAGNIGKPLVSLYDNNHDYIIAEISSYQASLIESKPLLSILTSLSEDHLEWHRGKENYVQDKIKALNLKNYISHEPFMENTGWLKAEYKITQKDDLETKKEKIKIITTLKGKHNFENLILAATAAKKIYPKLTLQDIAKTMKNLEPLSSRLETLGYAKKTEYISDFLATTPEAVIASMESMNKQKCCFVLGGKDRGINYNKLIQYITKNKIEIIILESQIAKKFKDVNSETFQSIEEVVKKTAGKYDKVVFSPGASTEKGTYLDREKELKKSLKGY